MSTKTPGQHAYEATSPPLPWEQLPEDARQAWNASGEAGPWRQVTAEIFDLAAENTRLRDLLAEVIGKFHRASDRGAHYEAHATTKQVDDWARRAEARS